MGEYVRAGDLGIWTEQVGKGSDVLLIGGLGDTVESWQFELDGLPDRYRLTAFDNRGAGRTAMPDEPVSVETMADDAAALLLALDVPNWEDFVVERLLGQCSDPGDRRLTVAGGLGDEMGALLGLGALRGCQALEGGDRHFVVAVAVAPGAGHLAVDQERPWS